MRLVLVCLEQSNRHIAGSVDASYLPQILLPPAPPSKAVSSPAPTLGGIVLWQMLAMPVVDRPHLPVTWRHPLPVPASGTHARARGVYFKRFGSGASSIA